MRVILLEAHKSLKALHAETLTNCKFNPLKLALFNTAFSENTHQHQLLSVTKVLEMRGHRLQQNH